MLVGAALSPVRCRGIGAGKSQYRPEIDGLRAFAVAAVIVNHFSDDWLPSGYLGVDIFFVISGYVITSSLVGRQSKNLPDFIAGFYGRRIRRLAPALVVFVMITSVLITLFNPDPALVLTTGAASLFGVSNLFLLVQSVDYFAQSTELNPFAHTWSLGVEEQFYLLFPFLIWFSGFGRRGLRGARVLFLWIGALAMASLLGFIVFYQVDQPAAYFLMPPRFWEIAAGCLTFIVCQRRTGIVPALERVPPMLVVTAMVGVMMLPLTVAVPATLGMVVLAAALIVGLKRGTLAYEIFTFESVVFLGLVSYSLYLWHWGVLCISRWTIGISWWSLPLQLGLMLLLATLSYRFVEQPFRRRVWDAGQSVTVFKGLALLVAAAFGVLLIHRSRASFLAVGGGMLGPEAYADTGIIQSDIHCHLPAKSLDPIAECLGGASPNSPTIYIVGDSHASNHYFSIRDAVAGLAKRPQVKLLVDWGLVNWFRGRNYCGSYDPCIKDSWAKHRDFFAKVVRKGDVVMFSLWRDKVVRRRTRLPRSMDDGKVAILESRLKEFAALIESLGGRVVLVDDIPMVCEPGINYQHFVLRMGQHEKCSVPAKVSLLDRIGMTTLYRGMAASRPGEVFYFDPHAALCAGDVCNIFDRRPQHQKRILYGDAMGHFRPEFSAPLVDEWQSFFLKLFPPGPASVL